MSSDPEGNEVCYQAACKVFAVSIAPCGVQSYRCSESHVVEKKTPAPDRQILICVRAHAGMLWGKKKIYPVRVCFQCMFGSSSTWFLSQVHRSLPESV